MREQLVLSGLDGLLFSQKVMDSWQGSFLNSGVLT